MISYYLPGINPTPWTSPSISIGRKNGKPFPLVYSSAELKAYQAAIREHFDALDPQPTLIDVKFVLRFYFWRQLPAYRTDRERNARKHEADVTNLQKATEDALQGVLFANDRNVAGITSWIMEQGHDTSPAILIELQRYYKLPHLPRITMDTPKNEPNEQTQEREEMVIKEVF